MLCVWPRGVDRQCLNPVLGYLIAHAHSARPWALDRGPLAKEPSARIRDQHGGNIASKLFQILCKMMPTWLLNGPWRPPGGLLEVSLEPLKRLGRPSGGFQWLMGGSWTPLGALLGPKKEVLNGSWPIQEEFQDRFQPLWGQEAPERDAKKVQNQVQEVTRAEHEIP